MVYKPLEKRVFLRYIAVVGWTLCKGGIDYNLYDEKDDFVCAVKIAHGKKNKRRSRGL